MIFREAAERPIRGTVLTLGRQTIFASPDEVFAMLERFGIEPKISHAGLDTSTKQTIAEGAERISDTDFFRMLGADEVVAIDVSDYEGAQYVHDLNWPIAESFEGICDLIVDGSLLDNVWNPCQAMMNVGRMMRPGARCFIDNRSNSGGPGIAYMMFSGPWFFDYFVANDFEDCQVFSNVYADGGRRILTYMLSPAAAMKQWGNGQIQSPHTMHTVNVTLFAQKGQNSTWNKIATQQAYRSDEEWARFIPRIASYAEHRRLPLFRADDGQDIEGASIRYGWERVLPDGTRIRPLSGLRFLPDGSTLRPAAAG